MAISNDAARRLTVALGNPRAGTEVVGYLNSTGGTDPSVTTVTTTGDITSGGNLLLASGKVVKINNVQVVGAPVASQTSVAVTYTSGSAPTITGNAITVADSTTPTVVELLAFCTALKANVGSILTALKTHGLMTT